jgi:hypothetical protein
MNLGEMSWRPKLWQIGYAPKGEEWRCWHPGLRTRPGEVWSEKISLSLTERWHMAVGYGWARELQERMVDCDVYTRVHDADFFRFVLTLPKPLAEILDDIRIPRTRTVEHFIPMFGPPPEFHGPLEPTGIRSAEQRLLDAEKDRNELSVQPSFAHIENLPILKMPSVESWKRVSELLVAHMHKQ